jgi:hypothetical protein
MPLCLSLTLNKSFMFSDVIQVRWHSIYSIAKIGWEEAKMGAWVLSAPPQAAKLPPGLKLMPGAIGPADPYSKSIRYMVAETQCRRCWQAQVR